MQTIWVFAERVTTFNIEIFLAGQRVLQMGECTRTTGWNTGMGYWNDIFFGFHTFLLSLVELHWLGCPQGTYSSRVNTFEISSGIH